MEIKVTDLDEQSLEHAAAKKESSALSWIGRVMKSAPRFAIDKRIPQILTSCWLECKVAIAVPHSTAGVGMRALADHRDRLELIHHRISLAELALPLTASNSNSAARKLWRAASRPRFVVSESDHAGASARESAESIPDPDAGTHSGNFGPDVSAAGCPNPSDDPGSWSGASLNRHSFGSLRGSSCSRSWCPEAGPAGVCVGFARYRCRDSAKVWGRSAQPASPATTSSARRRRSATAARRDLAAPGRHAIRSPLDERLVDLLEPAAIDPLVVHERRPHAAAAIGMAARAIVLAEQTLAADDGFGIVIVGGGPGSSVVTRL